MRNVDWGLDDGKNPEGDEEMRWRPIKSAPKDRLVLLSCNENPEYDPYVCVGRWVDCPHSNTLIEAWRKGEQIDPDKIFKGWHDGYVGIMTGNIGKSWEMRGGILFHPTHWMPLPKGYHFRKHK